MYPTHIPLAFPFPFFLRLSASPLVLWMPLAAWRAFKGSADFTVCSLYILKIYHCTWPSVLPAAAGGCWEMCVTFTWTGVIAAPWKVWHQSFGPCGLACCILLHWWGITLCRQRHMTQRPHWLLSKYLFLHISLSYNQHYKPESVRVWFAVMRGAHIK